MILKAHFRGSVVALELAMEAAESYNLRVVCNIYSHDVLRPVQLFISGMFVALVSFDKIISNIILCCRSGLK